MGTEGRRSGKEAVGAVQAVEEGLGSGPAARPRAPLRAQPQWHGFHALQKHEGIKRAHGRATGTNKISDLRHVFGWQQGPGLDFYL